MKVTALILYPSAASVVVEPSGREVWDPDGDIPWVKVGEETLDATSPEAAAETIYARWNNGSGSESDTFRAAKRRSFSCGDMVILPEMEVALRCASFGFDVVDAPVADTIADEGDDTMDIDYMFRSRRTNREADTP